MNGIDEWATGIKTDIAFTAVDYRTVFDAHLNAFALPEMPPRSTSYGQICTKLYNVAGTP